MKQAWETMHSDPWTHGVSMAHSCPIPKPTVIGDGMALNTTNLLVSGLASRDVAYIVLAMGCIFDLMSSPLDTG